MKCFLEKKDEKNNFNGQSKWGRNKIRIGYQKLKTEGREEKSPVRPFLCMRRRKQTNVRCPFVTSEIAFDRRTHWALRLEKKITEAVGTDELNKDERTSRM